MTGKAKQHTVLVGTYRKVQLEKWILPRGLYNYPVKATDTALREAAPSVGELWLYAGKSGKRRFSARFEREATPADLASLGYPSGKGKPHSDRYLLFRVSPLDDAGGPPANVLGWAGVPPAVAPRIFLRMEDFVRSPAAREKIRAALRAPSAQSTPSPSGLSWLPDDLAEDWLGNLMVCEEAMQLDFWGDLCPVAGDTISSICQALGVDDKAPGWPDSFGKALRKEYVRNANRPIRTLSLFSGAGGLDIGFSDAGFQIVESVEIEDRFCETLEMNSGTGKQFPGSRVNCIDIRKFGGGHLGKIDFIIGGPPCQTFSAAGRRANGVLGTTDARGVLFREYVRLLGELNPVGFLFENVYGITGAQNGEAWAEIRKAFSSAGYRLFFRILDAADYGVPQHRERLIIVGLKHGEFRFPRPTHGPDSLDKNPFYNAGTAVSNVRLAADESKPGLGGRFGHLLPDIPPGLNYSFYTEKMGHPNPVFAWRSKFSDFLYKADPETPVRTIKASGGAYTGPLHWDNRFFSVGEYKRLQTFPDDYRISGSKQVAVKQIGNSVPPQLARMLALSIQQQVFHAALPFRVAQLDFDESLTFRKRKNSLTREYQGKASSAIGVKSANASVRLKPEAFSCFLSDSFRFEKAAPGVGEFDVSYSPESGVLVSDRAHPTAADDIRIHVEPADGQWNILNPKIDVDVRSASRLGFTVGWKAFEQIVADNNVKTDLVQLNGYYQYEPRLRCSCELPDSFPYRFIVSDVVAGNNVARILSTRQLADSWHVSESEVWNAAEFLRSIGYEVRNANTNPQIPDDHWLVPYAFPTLTHRSVQLRKKIR